jgi:restriction system protein
VARSSGSRDNQRSLAAQQRQAQQVAARGLREEELRRKAVEKERQATELAKKVADAASQTEAAEQRMRELAGLLSRSLTQLVPGVDFGSMKKPAVVPSLDLGADAAPEPAPLWGAFVPTPPGVLSRLFGGDARYALRLAAAEQRFEQIKAGHEAAETARQQRVAKARQQHAQLRAKVQARVAAQHAEVDLFAEGVRARTAQHASRYFQMVIDQVQDPAGFPRKRFAGYVPDSTLLAMEWYLPNVDIIPQVKTYRYVKSRDTTDTTPRPIAEIRLAYQRLVTQIALRALRVVFAADVFKMVDTVVFNGRVDAIDRSTGQAIRPHLITLRATRDQFMPLVLSQVDPVACVQKYFAADVSRHPDELQEVMPVMKFEMADPRIVAAVDVISGLDKRPNLMALSHKEFEHFAHNLFTRMGFDTKLFKADGDGGVDCVAYDPTPIRGGKYVIQVKQYARKRLVPPSAVRDLYGTMQHEGATTGILITTSGFGPSSYEFANGKPMQLIDAQGLLALCKEYNIPARIL